MSQKQFDENMRYSMKNWNDIQELINQIVSIRDRHVTLNVNVQSVDSGQIYADFGTFGNASMPDLESMYNFLAGVLFGMNINRG